MEGKGIWDLIAKFATGKNGESNETLNEENKQNSQPQEKGQGLENPLSPLSGSFLKSYNPFASPLIEKPQITSARADKPLRKSIDLNGSKNLASSKGKDKTRNIIDLINKHNFYSHKINNNSDK